LFTKIIIVVAIFGLVTSSSMQTESDSVVQAIEIDSRKDLARIDALTPQEPPVEEISVKEEPKTYSTYMSAEELKELLYTVGFRGEKLKQAWAVAMKESTGRPLAHNQNSKTGDNSYGLFQINMIGGMGPARREEFGLESNENLFDPMLNAKIAYIISEGGTDWGPWNGITKKTKEWMSQFPD
jgi:hypothetical protein